ncbi:MAG: flagellar biosynthetic protein FliR [Bacillota bacterium]|jgi:flagellar biosynthetic protein FliR|nr:flagellar biosynthetic protein FliR [Bacillota bacterium]
MGVSLVDFVRFALALIRFATFLVVIPVLNMRNAPILVKIGLAALCALAVMPELDAAYNPEHLGVLAVLALQEVAVGLLLAFVLILVFSAVTIAGHFIDTPIGFGMASVFDPALGGQVPVFSQFNHVLASLVFFSLDAHLWVLQALHSSFRAIPLGGAFSFQPSAALITELIGEVFVIAVQIALPIVATILLTDIGLGIVIRAVPQINVFVLGFPIKIMVGMAVIVFALPVFVHIISQLFAADGLLARYLEGLLVVGGG